MGAYEVRRLAYALSVGYFLAHGELARPCGDYEKVGRERWLFWRPRLRV